MRKEIGLPVSIVLALLALVSIWTSMDFYAIGRESGLGTLLNDYAYRRVIAAKIPPMFEIACFLLAAVLWRYGKRRETLWGKGDVFFTKHSPCSFFTANRLIELRRAHRFFIFPGRQQGGLIDQVGQISSHKTRGETGNLAQVDIGTQHDMPAMNFQDGFPPVDVRPVDQDLPVKPARARNDSDIRPDSRYKIIGH